MRRFWGYGKTKIPSRRPVTETNLSEPDASATVIKNKHLPRINTELHGRKQNQKIRPGNITHLSEPDASATVIKLKKRGQVSFSALNIIYSWFRLTAEKET